jgi:hypothetical protein
MIRGMTVVPALDRPRATAAPGRPRLVRLVWWAVLLGLVVTGAGVVAVLVYRPLTVSGGLSWAGELTGARSAFVPGPTARDASNTFGSEWIVGPMPHGGRLGIVVDVSNDGPVPVVVDGVEPVLPDVYSAGTDLFVADQSAEEAISTMVRTPRFTVPAHGYRTVGFAVDVRRDCAPTPGRATVTVTGVELRYHLAGVPRTSFVPLHEMAVSLDEAPSCDGIAPPLGGR